MEDDVAREKVGQFCTGHLLQSMLGWTVGHSYYIPFESYKIR